MAKYFPADREAMRQSLNLSDVSGPDPVITWEEFKRWPLAVTEVDEDGCRHFVGYGDGAKTQVRVMNKDSATSGQVNTTHWQMPDGLTVAEPEWLPPAIPSPPVLRVDESWNLETSGGGLIVCPRGSAVVMIPDGCPIPRVVGDVTLVRPDGSRVEAPSTPA